MQGDKCPGLQSETSEEVEPKIVTYHIDAGDGELIVDRENLEYGLACEMPSDYDLSSEMDELEEDCVITEIVITVKKVMTKAEFDALPEKS